MKHDAQIVVRVPHGMADQLKVYADGLTEEFGVRVSLAAATRKLLEKALATEATMAARKRVATATAVAATVAAARTRRR